MKPAEFDYVAPGSVVEAADLLAQRPDETRVLAGGQSLVPLMNLRLAAPAVVVDINGIADLDRIEERDGGVVIGAIARQADVERSPLVHARCPLVAEALRWVGHPQLRNRGTVVGSLVHHDPAAELPAVAVALGARVTIVAAAGDRRVVDAADFFVSHFTTDVRPGELVTEVWFPSLPSGTGTAFVEVARRRGDFAIVGVAAAVHRDGGRITDAWVVACGVGARPVRCREVEDALAGREATTEGFAEAAAPVVAEAGLAPVDDVHASATYRRRVLPVLVERALVAANARAA